MLREYELTVIAKGDLPEPEVTKLLTRYETLMTNDGGEILQRTDWGNKKIAFAINKQHRGHYVNYDFVGTSANLSEIERLMRIDENVLRYLSVRVGENVDVKARKIELAKLLAAAASFEQQDEGADFH